MTEDSIWRTWKPYAVVAVGIAGAFWWYTSQSSFARLKEGGYDCRAVFVNASGKYELLVDEDGNPYPTISATVRGGMLDHLAGNTAVPSDQLASLTVTKRGNSHFHVTDDPAGHSYNAVACDYADGSPTSSSSDRASGSVGSSSSRASAKSCSTLFNSILSRERVGDTAGAINAELDALGDSCPSRYQVFVDYVSIKGSARAAGASACSEYRTYDLRPAAIALARKDGFCSAPKKDYGRADSAVWRCEYEPTFNEDWHDDAVCSNGVEQQRPYLRKWDSFVTEAELMDSAREYEQQLNGR